MNWYDYSARYLAVDFPVLPTMDPLAEKYYSWSPYAYCLNNPMRYMDPLGMDTIPVNDIMNWQTFDTENDVIELNTVTVIPKEEGSSEVEQYIEPIRYYAGGGPGRYPASGRLDGLGMMSPEFIFLSGGRSLYLSSARGAAGVAASKMITATGQRHHLFTRKIMNALNNHRTLKGFFSREDPKYIYNALDDVAHKGYQAWHRQYDDIVINWLQDYPFATPEQFNKFLHTLHQEPWLKSRIPNVNL